MTPLVVSTWTAPNNALSKMLEFKYDPSNGYIQHISSGKYVCCNGYHGNLVLKSINYDWNDESGPNKWDLMASIGSKCDNEQFIIRLVGDEESVYLGRKQSVYVNDCKIDYRRLEYGDKSAEFKFVQHKSRKPKTYLIL